MSLSPLTRRGPLVLGLLFLFGFQALANNEESEARMRRDITYLASDECEGRGPGTKGIDKAADYIAGEFKKAGLKPGGTAGYFQPFTIFEGVKQDGPATMRLRGPLGQEIVLRPGFDFQVLGSTGKGNVDAPVVFVGYGATAPGIGYDDYKGVDVTGKVVILLRHTPRWENDDVPFDGDLREEHALLVTKQSLAESHRAAAIVLVNDATEVAEGDKLMNFADGRGSAGNVPFVHMKRALLEPMLRSGTGTGVRDVELTIDRDLQPRSTTLQGWTAAIETKVTRTTTPVKNVIGVLEGTGPLAKETVVIGAHYDHLGYGGPGSLAKERNKKQIHHGADDNASGTTAVIELARRFGQMQNRQGRRLVFITFSGEERGLLGSQHYCNREPLFALKDTAAMVNLDMVGRLRADDKTGKDVLLVEGTGTAKGFDQLVADLNEKPSYLLKKTPGASPFSDHDSFYKKKIPVIFYWTDKHDDYHKPSDTADRINVTGMRRVTDLAEQTVAKLATVPERPEYIYIPSPFKMMAGKMPRLGIAPKYESGVNNGLLVGAVSDGGPAAKAGLKAGDLIVELAGRQVNNIDTYMVILRRQRAGRPLDVVVLRNGEKLTFKVTPQ